MNWETWCQLIGAMGFGAWVYSCGARSASIIPGANLAKVVSGAIAERIAGNGKPKAPGLPRITS